MRLSTTFISFHKSLPSPLSASINAITTPPLPSNERGMSEDPVHPNSLATSTLPSGGSRARQHLRPPLPLTDSHPI